MALIGRIEERNIFNDCLQSNESRLIAVYGRRRVGKTFLIRNHFDKLIKFEIAGLHNGEMQDQLKQVFDVVSAYGLPQNKLAYPTSWTEAFALIQTYLNTLKGQKKKVIFFDELPWFDTPKSKFLMAFENFWNTYCTKRNDLVVVICGSAASWMIKKIVKNKGGLHNRIAERIQLKPFTLRETELFLMDRFIKMSRYDILQLYMVTGGVPFYLDRIRKGESLAQFINRVCFMNNGFLRDEYDELLKSLFDNSQNHELVLRTLVKKSSGFTRMELASATKLASGGSLTEVIDELLESGFVSKYQPFGTNKTLALYKLTDHFTLFHHKFMKDEGTIGKNVWNLKANTPSWMSWAGLAFELICFNHLEQITDALKLQAISCKASPWRYEGDNQGVQIDLIIERADRVIHLCEMKFSKSIFILSKSEALSLRNKIAQLNIQPSAKNNAIFPTFITTFGLKPNEYVQELVQNELTMDDLFL
jgi:uncharacterized protein